MTRRPFSLTELKPRTAPEGLSLDDRLAWSNLEHARIVQDFQVRQYLIISYFAPPADDDIRPGVLFAKTEARDPPPGMNLADHIAWSESETARLCSEALEQLAASLDLRRGATRH